MMELLSLGYVGIGIGAGNLADWADFGVKLLGMQMTENGASRVALRMDDRRQRLFVDREVPAGSRYFGWEVADSAALGAVAAERLGVTVQEPFMQLSFIALSVIPQLRLTDGGLVDVDRFAYVPVEVERD